MQVGKVVPTTNFLYSTATLEVYQLIFPQLKLNSTQNVFIDTIT